MVMLVIQRVMSVTLMSASRWVVRYCAAVADAAYTVRASAILYILRYSIVRMGPYNSSLPECCTFSKDGIPKLKATGLP